MSSVEKSLVILVLLGRKDEESARELRNVFRTNLATGLAQRRNCRFLSQVTNVNVLGSIGIFGSIG